MHRTIPLILLIIFCLSAIPLFCDEIKTPEPYSPDEFSPFLLNIRRGEIIFFGSVPLTFILSGFAWQIGEAAAASSYPYSDEQHTCNILITAGALSLSIALIDFFLGLGN